MDSFSEKSQGRLGKWLVHIIFVLIAAGIIGVNYKPAYNWDILPYMALALNHTVEDKDSVHSRVYNIIKEGQQRGEVTNGTFGNFTKRIPYRVQCYQNADKFNSQLFYYRTKPLYNLLVYGLYTMGVPLIQATIIPSVVACFFILLVLYAWMSLYTHRLMTITLAILVALLPVFKELQNTSSPDALSAVFVLSAMYLFFAGKHRGWIFLCLAFATLARIDNFIFVTVMLYAILKPTRNRLVFIASGSIVAAIIAILAIPWLAGNSPLWFTEFKFLESHVQYYFHVRNVFRAFFGDAYYWIWVALGLLLLTVKRKLVRQLVLIVTVSVVVRLVLFPSLQERFFAPYEFALIVALLMAVKGKAFQPGITETP
ncbi:MAG TPA: hypothetical protein VIN07_04835 [Flavipsychrobacter sp.]